jgi:hypothetical protein
MRTISERQARPTFRRKPLSNEAHFSQFFRRFELKGKKYAGDWTVRAAITMAGIYGTTRWKHSTHWTSALPLRIGPRRYGRTTNGVSEESSRRSRGHVAEGYGVFDGHRRLRRSRPFPPQRRIVVDRLEQATQRRRNRAESGPQLAATWRNRAEGRASASAVAGNGVRSEPVLR